MLRVLSALGGVALGAFALWASLWVLLTASIAGHRPDPAVDDGDPCCAHPDTWGQVLSWGGMAVFEAAVLGALCAGVLGLLSFATTGRAARARWSIGLVAGLPLLTAAGVAAGALFG